MATTINTADAHGPVKMPAGARTAYATCPLCEATCGLEVELDGEAGIARVRGDHQDGFSRGFICPKGASIKALEEDPDRLRAPLVRRDGELRPAGWDEAFAAIERGLRPVIDRHGAGAIGVYLGNPVVHNLSLSLYSRVLLKALGTRHVYSASTVDQMPKQVAVGLMFGTLLSVPVPDLDHTDYLLILGADPMVSNGSLMTAPDVPARLRAIRARGGKIVVLDPRRSRTASEAAEHYPIRPGSDAYCLFGVVHTLFAEGLVRLGRLVDHTAGVDEVAAMARDFAPDVVSPRCGIPAEVIRRLARELAAAKRAAVYARIGTCTQEFGTL